MSIPETNRYLEQEVFAAHPIKLRLMLIEKAVGLSHTVETLWKQNDTLTASQWLLRIREILNELLSGVVKTDDSLAQQVSDLYVFMLKQLGVAESSKSPDELRKLREILEIERSTWSTLLKQFLSAQHGSGAAPHFAGAPVLSAGNELASAQGFSLEA